MRNLLTLLLLLHAAPAFAGWTSGVNPKHLVSPGLASIVYSPDQKEGAPTFKEALDALARAGKVQRLEVITLHWLVQEASFQKELMAGLQTSAPNELAEALSSAGNMHNPKFFNSASRFRHRPCPHLRSKQSTSTFLSTGYMFPALAPRNSALLAVMANASSCVLCGYRSRSDPR
jgi:hypothetical protein